MAKVQLGYTLQKKFGCSVHFNDYNEEVIENHLMDALFINNLSSSQISASSGDWSHFKSERKFDVIVTCETIYSEEYYTKLTELLEACLSPNGVIILGAKSHYFGCGGSTYGFTKFVENRGSFRVENVWKSDRNESLEREIMRITWK